MHNDFELLSTLTACMATALMLALVSHRLGFSPIVGYLLAGVAVGPFTPGFVADRHLAEQLAEVGVILLMFGVGLQFHFEELLAVRRIAIPGALFQSLIATSLGTALGALVGWGWSAGLVYGMAISVASTVVLIRVLVDHHDLHTPTGHVAVGWLVVEDLFTVVILVLLPALFGQNAVGFIGIASTLLITALKIALLVVGAFVLGGRFIPWLLERVARTRSRELFTLTVLVVALGLAVGSTKLFGVSMALGAFLAGMVVGRSEFSLRAATDALPMRDAFAVLFFVATGMLFDPHSLLESPGLIAGTLTIVLLAKPLAALVLVLLFRYPVRVALGVAVALAQIGEFSFMLAAMARTLGVLPDAATNALVGAAIVSISLNPLLYRLVDPTQRFLSRVHRPGSEQEHQEEISTTGKTEQDEKARWRTIVVGHGPVGRTLTQLLRENELEPTVIEMNLETVQRLRGEGVAVVYGDASHRDTLMAAGVASASTLLLSASHMIAAAEIIRLAREANPTIRVLVRCTYVGELSSLSKAGASDVFSGEGEVALAMTESVLRELGATPEQIDRERDRVRGELLGTAPSPPKDPS